MPILKEIHQGKMHVQSKLLFYFQSSTVTTNRRVTCNRAVQCKNTTHLTEHFHFHTMLNIVMNPQKLSVHFRAKNKSRNHKRHNFSASSIHSHTKPNDVDRMTKFNFSWKCVQFVAKKLRKMKLITRITRCLLNIIFQVKYNDNQINLN